MAELVRAGAVVGYPTDSVRKLIPVRRQDLNLLVILAAMTCCTDFYTVLSWIRKSQKMNVAQLAIYSKMDQEKVMNLFEQQAKGMVQILRHLRKQSETALTKWKVELSKQDYIWPNEDENTRKWEILLGKKKPSILKPIPKKKRSLKEIKSFLYEIFHTETMFEHLHHEGRIIM